MLMLAKVGQFFMMSVMALNERIRGPRKPSVEEFGEERDSLLNQVGGYLSPILSDLLEMGMWAPDIDWSRRLKREGYLKSPSITRAFKLIRRYDFLPVGAKGQCGFDRPIQIGHRQTNSQPSLVAKSLEGLQPEPGQKILDIGSGSGWTTALLAAIVGQKGRVIGVERIPQLVEMGQTNIARYKGIGHAEIRQAGEQLGLPNEAPFDRIIVAAQVKEEWLPLLEAQLSDEGGILVVPVVSEESYGKSGVYDQPIVKITRNKDEYTREIITEGTSFVPLIFEPVNGQKAALAKRAIVGTVKTPGESI